MAKKLAGMRMENDKIDDSIYKLLLQEKAPQIVELLDKKCVELQISQRQLSNLLGIERRSLQRLLEGETQKIDIITTIKISQFLDLDIKEFIQLYIAEMKTEEINDLELARKRSFIHSNFDLKALKKTGFIEEINDYIGIEKKITSFLGIERIFEYGKFTSAPYFSRTKRDYSGKMIRFWVTCALLQIKRFNNRVPYNRELLKEIIPKMRGLTRNEKDGIKLLTLALAEAGVTVLYQTYLKGIQIRGATFIYENRPYIFITDMNQRYDTIWFALAHELYHVLIDFDKIHTTFYHLTGWDELQIDMMSEESADQFGRVLFVKIEAMEYISNYIAIPGLVNQFAKENNVHPAMIYGSYLYKKNNKEEYQKFRKLIPDAKVTLNKILVNPWVANDVNEVVAKTEELLNTIH